MLRIRLNDDPHNSVSLRHQAWTSRSIPLAIDLRGHVSRSAHGPLVPTSFRESVVPKVKGKQDEQRRKQEVRDSEICEGSPTYLQAARAHVVAMRFKRFPYSPRVALHETEILVSQVCWLWCLGSGGVRVLPFELVLSTITKGSSPLLLLAAR